MVRNPHFFARWFGFEIGGTAGTHLVAKVFRMGGFDRKVAVSGRVIINRSPNPYVPWIEECSPSMREKAIEIGLCLLLEHPSRFLLSLDKIMATIEGTGSVTSIMKARRESEEVRHAGGNDLGI